MGVKRSVSRSNRHVCAITKENMTTEYWEKRHAAAPNEYEASWEGDTCARWLELQFIESALQRREGKWDVVELGCGGFTLDEGRRPKLLHKIGSYVGYDIAPAAIEVAQKKVKDLPFPAEFRCEPVQRAPNIKPGTLLLCRRLIQNLDKDDRGWIFDYVARAGAAIILECSLDGMARTNKVRTAHGHPPLVEAPFNHYLTASETGRLEAAAPAVDVSWPLGGYYYMTRGIKNTRNDTSAYISTAFRAHGFHFGPLQAWTWNLDA